MTTDSSVVSVRTCLAIWGWLAVLMLVSVFLAELSIPKGTIVFLVLLLSTIKAVLVALYYMHLKFDRWLVSFVAIFPLVLVGLAILVVASSRLVKL